MVTREPSIIMLADNALKSIPALKNAGTAIKKSLHEAVLAGGAPVRTLADVLHGTWLGHPLHPVLTDITIGAWTFGTLFDVLAQVSGRRKMRDAGDTLISIGTASAVPTALVGITDYSTIKDDAVEYGMAHALLNTVTLSLYALSLRARSQRDRSTATTLSVIGLSVTLISAWLGGELVYKKRVGVNHSPTAKRPKNWTAVMAATDLVEGQPQRVGMGDAAVLLYRKHGAVYAISAICSHAGGPLEEGKFEGTCVQCPWHDSVYDLRDGRVVHGPSTYSQPRYETRTNNGQIEIRVPRETSQPAPAQSAARLYSASE